MWKEAFRAKYDLVGKPYGREEFDQLLGHCMATTDFPACVLGPELIAVSQVPLTGLLQTRPS